MGDSEKTVPAAPLDHFQQWAEDLAAEPRPSRKRLIEESLVDAFRLGVEAAGAAKTERT